MYRIKTPHALATILCLLVIAAWPARGQDAIPLESSISALLQSHARAIDTPAGEQFRADIRTQVEHARALRSAGDITAADTRLRDAYEQLIRGIRDDRHQEDGDEPGPVPAAPGDTVGPAYASRLGEVEMLLDVIRRHEPTDTAAFRIQRNREAVAISHRLDRARHRYHDDPAAALQMLDAIYAEEKQAIRRLKENDSNKALHDGVAAPLDDGGKALREFHDRDASIGELLQAQGRILDTEFPGDNPERKVAASAKQLRAVAASLLDAGDLAAARETLDRAYALVQHSVKRLRQGRTLVRSLTFESPQHEYEYEIQRHDMHLELAELLMSSRRHNSDVARTGKRIRERSQTLRTTAELLAGGGDYSLAVTLLEEASNEIYKLFRVAGFYVPGN